MTPVFSRLWQLASYLAVLLLLQCRSHTVSVPAASGDSSGGWSKFSGSPVLGGRFGTIFDVSVLKLDSEFVMLSSWRPQKSIALHRSVDGIRWSDPVSVLMPDSTTGLENEVNRPALLLKDGVYHLWYTGQSRDSSWIGYATSADLVHWKRESSKPVLSADKDWEKSSLMCPSVLWDAQRQQFQMWYSGGEDYEPDAIGYATSTDGVHWSKHTANPIFRADSTRKWEQAKVTACQVIRRKEEYVMFYIGFRDVDYAQIGIARSKNGIDHWERHPANPIIRPGAGWDSSAVYKPYAIFDGSKWILWYNGRNDRVEQIGIAMHPGEDLGFKND